MSDVIKSGLSPLAVFFFQNVKPFRFALCVMPRDLKAKNSFYFNSAKYSFIKSSKKMLASNQITTV